MMEWKLNKLMTLVRNKNWVTSYKIFFDIFTSAFYNSHIREVISQFKVFKKKKKNYSTVYKNLFNNDIRLTKRIVERWLNTSFPSLALKISLRQLQYSSDTELNYFKL